MSDVFIQPKFVSSDVANLSVSGEAHSAGTVVPWTAWVPWGSTADQANAMFEAAAVAALVLAGVTVGPTDTRIFMGSIDKGFDGIQWIATPTRLLNTPFQPHATRTTLCVYSVRIDASISVVGGAAGHVEVRSDPSPTPTAVRARVDGGITGTGLLGLGGVLLDVPSSGTLVVMVPPGDYVSIVTVTTAGSPVYTITSQVEYTL
jgi:hypothetical protein